MGSKDPEGQARDKSWECLVAMHASWVRVPHHMDCCILSRLYNNAHMPLIGQG